MEGCCIREAKRTDARKMFELMQQHAAEQNTILPAHLTLEAFVECGWGSAPIFLAFVAEQEGATEGELKGYVLAHCSYTWKGRTMYMKEVYVIPAARHSGVAMQLCRELIKAALNMGVVCCDVLLDTANKAGVRTLEKLGAQNFTEAKNCHFFSMDKKAMAKMQASCNDKELQCMRPASPKDFPGVMTMMQEMAISQQMPNGLKFDATTLATDASPPGKFFECLVAESNEGLVGYTLFSHTFSSEGRGIFMGNLYVRPTYRHQGLGTALMARVAQRGLSLGASQLQFFVLSWNTPSIAFYNLKGATNVTAGKGIHIYRFVVSVLREIIEKDVQEN